MNSYIYDLRLLVKHNINPHTRDDVLYLKQPAQCTDTEPPPHIIYYINVLLLLYDIV